MWRGKSAERSSIECVGGERGKEGRGRVRGGGGGKGDSREARSREQ